MNKNMEQMISKDLGIGIDQIRKTSWQKLDKLPKKISENPFRPQNMFIVSGNINLAQNREMGMTRINLQNIYRKAIYRIKCLLKNKKNG